MDTVVLTDNYELKKSSKATLKSRKLVLCVCGLVLFVTVLVGGVYLGVTLSDDADKRWCGVKSYPIDEDCYRFSSINCSISLIESIPDNLTYPSGSPSHPSTYNSWLQLLDVAQSTIYIASSYWSLRSDDLPVKDPSSWQGEDIFNKLVKAGKRGVKIRIVHEVDTKYLPNSDTKLLEKMGLAEVRVLNLDRLIGAGIIHTKMWLVDNMHFYLGSANMDWRSLTQVKELGLLTSNCGCLANDMAKIFDIYWMLAEPKSKIPHKWPGDLDTIYNKGNTYRDPKFTILPARQKTDSPMAVTINGHEAGNVYLSSSPPPLCTNGRTTDIDSILDVIHKAKKFIHVSVMDYSPTFLYIWPEKYWPVIDDALRTAAFDRGVEVHFMASDWAHTKPAMIPFLKSLAVLDDIRYVNIKVRLFKVPMSESQAKIPYARVQHTKYMVTENAAYVGTSNWSADYFVNTAGIGYIINQTSTDAFNRLYMDTIQSQLEDVFARDWNSEYTKSIWEY